MKKIIRILLFGSMASFILAAVLSGFPILVFLWNLIVPTTSSQLSKVLSRPVDTNSNIIEKNDEHILPKQDLSLSEIPNIRIDSIGLNTEIIEKPVEEYEEALRQGVWRVPEFGTPTDRSKPIILVAHRFGYLEWDREFRRKNSFYNLPDLENGEQIEIVWDQRKFTYEIYQQEEGEDISHYSADLILYTCKFLKSDTRIFQYARLVSDQ